MGHLGRSRGRTSPKEQYAFAAIVVVIVAIATAHLYVIDGLTAIRFGLPAWLWVQLGVIAGLLALAWVAIGLVPKAEDREEGRR